MSVEPAASSAAASKSDQPSRQPGLPAATESAMGSAPVSSNAAANDEELEESSYHRDRFVLFNALPSSLVSALVHFIAFMVLALTTMPEPQGGDSLAIQ